MKRPQHIADEGLAPEYKNNRRSAVGGGTRLDFSRLHSCVSDPLYAGQPSVGVEEVVAATRSQPPTRATHVCGRLNSTQLRAPERQ